MGKYYGFNTHYTMYIVYHANLTTHYKGNDLSSLHTTCIGDLLPFMVLRHASAATAVRCIMLSLVELRGAFEFIGDNYFKAIAKN